jgi:sec-independent protein translocase protein TatB
MFPEGRILDFVIVGAVALIVVGPKDLPILMRKVGQFLAKMRAMAAEFRASFDEMARQSELDELRREVEALRSGRPLENVITGAATGGTTVFDDIHADLNQAGAPLHEPMANESAADGAAEHPPPASPVLPPGGEEKREGAAPHAKVETGG